MICVSSNNGSHPVRKTFTTLHATSLHLSTLHFIQLNFAQLHFTALNYPLIWLNPI